MPVKPRISEQGRNPAYRAYRTNVLRTGVLAAALVSAMKFAWGAGALPLDDAYIHLTFARNLAHGLGFCFNPGEPSLGFSSPLWVMLLGLAKYLGFDLVHASRLMSMVFFAGSAVLVFDITRISVNSVGDENSMWPPAFGLLAGLGMSASGNMLWLSGTGMEAMLFLFLGLASILLWGDGPPIRPLMGGFTGFMRLLAGGAALGLMILTRPSGLALAGILAALALLSGPRRKKILFGLGPAVLICAPWFVYSYFSTGFILPPTRAGKLASNLFNSGLSIKGAYHFTLWHLDYLWNYDRGLAVLLLMCLAGLIAAGASGLFGGEARKVKKFLFRWTPAGLVSLWAAVHFGMHSQLFRSTMIITPYHNLRYQVMLIPALLAGGAWLAAFFGERAGRLFTGAPRGIAPAVAALFFIVPLAAELSNASFWQRLYRANTEQIDREHLAAARWADEELPADARLAALDIGALGYRSGRYVIGLGGLIDPQADVYLEAARTGPYMAEKRATHYFALERYKSEGITGVFKDNGKLYALSPVKSFHYFPPLPYPVFLHSFSIEVYSVEYLGGG